MPSKARGVAHVAPKINLMKGANEVVKDRLVTQHENLKMLAKKHNDDKLVISFLIVGSGLIAFHFLVENK